MASHSYDFPFGIRDVAGLLPLNVRRRKTNSMYTDCPFCGDCRGKLNISYAKNVWRCNYCDEHGGMLDLYARINNTTNSDAYREICDALQNGATAQEDCTGTSNQEFPPTPTLGTNVEDEVPQSERASAQDIHQTLSLLFGMLSLNERHRAHLRSPKRGLNDEQIDQLGFKSTPPAFLCRSLAERLIWQGCMVQGVPGFYLDASGSWTVKFSRRSAGIIIPAIGVDGLIHGAQILLDVPFRNKGDPPDKAGTKYIWFSSSTKYMGVTSGSPVHFVGNPFARTIYITEGLLKADISHCLINRSFAAIAGANNVRQLEPLFALLARNGTELIVEAHDMDKFNNNMTSKGASKIYLMARQYGMDCRTLTWNPNYKGIDDWQLALRRKEKRHNEEQDTELLALPEAQRHHQTFRIYQLEFGEEKKPIPFAFSGIAALHKAGYEQPPAASYRLVWESTLICPSGQSDTEVLQRIFAQYGDHIPDGYGGRCLSPSDVVELHDEDKRRYFYRDMDGFVQVCFSPLFAKPKIQGGKSL